MFCGPAKHWFHLFVLKKVCVTFICTCVSPSWWQWLWKCDHCLHLPTQWYIGCHGFTKSLQTQMTQTHIPSFIHFFLMKTQEWKDCYLLRNIGIRGSNAKYKTGMKELMLEHWIRHTFDFVMCPKIQELALYFSHAVHISVCMYGLWCTLYLAHARLF